MNIIVKLNPGQGTDLGVNFELTSNAGAVTPSTATLDQLLAGVNAVVSNLATEIYVTSEGICTNTLTLPISTTTSTTLAPHTTTSTTLPPLCNLAGGTAVVFDLIYYPNAFVFGNEGSTSNDNICLNPAISVYGPPCSNEPCPVCAFYLPPQLFLDPYGLEPVPGVNLVRGLFGGFLPSPYYRYDSSTGNVGAYVSSCLS